jgi:hypothetical protein
MKRKAKVTGNKEINVVWGWFTNARSKNIHTSGPNLYGIFSLGRLQDGWIVLRRGTILCGMESVGNLQMWMTVQ